MSKGNVRKCYSCQALIELTVDQKIGFRATCPNCFAYLHCCKNCKNFQYGLPNHCSVPGTEMIADKFANNFCEEFTLLELPPKNAASLSDIENKLFGDQKLESLKNFSELFKQPLDKE